MDSLMILVNFHIYSDIFLSVVSVDVMNLSFSLCLSGKISELSRDFEVPVHNMVEFLSTVQC